jgi:hypothetical protein
MVGPLDDQYFHWLCAHVVSTSERRPTHTYWDVMRQLFEKEYVWIIPGDRNRAEDGRALRDEFLNSQVHPIADENWNHLGCSVLELLVGVSRRMSFMTSYSTSQAFWVIFYNLGLTGHTDATMYDQNDLDIMLDRLMWREYSFNGTGGMFPLKYASEDQRHVEIWYQLNAYVLENL